MNIVFMSMDTLPSTLWARDLYDQMHIRSDFRKWFPRMCQYGFIEGRDYEYTGQPRRGQDLLCHASCGGLHQPKAFTRYGDP